MIFIFQSILNTFVVVHTSPGPFSRLKKKLSPRSEKKLLRQIEFNPRLQSFKEDWNLLGVIKQVTSIEFSVL